MKTNTGKVRSAPEAMTALVETRPKVEATAAPTVHAGITDEPPVPAETPTQASNQERCSKKSEYLKMDLLNRGWKQSMIRRWLEEPDHVQHRWGGGEYYIYAAERVHKIEESSEWQRERDKWKRRAEKKPELVTVDLLQAIFAVNRSAKRHRDAAQRCYSLKKHGFARRSREIKEELYGLKERGIAEAFGFGRITPVQQKGGLIEYRGEGYCFHSTLLPNGVSLPQCTDDTVLYVDAKPRGSGEVRLCDAKHTLLSLPPVGDQFTRLALPIPPSKTSRPARYSQRSSDDDDDDDLDF
jgi:hypothetical protein